MMKKTIILLFMGLHLFSCGPQDNPQEAEKDQLTLEELKILEQLGVDKDAKYEDKVFADGRNISEWAKIHDPDFGGAFAETKSTKASTKNEKKLLLISRMTDVGHDLAKKVVWKEKLLKEKGVLQENGLAYVSGAKSTERIWKVNTALCQEDLYGLDCSGMIKVMAVKSFLYLNGSNTTDFAKLEVWNNAFSNSLDYTGLKMIKLGQIGISDLHNGDILVRAGKHIAMVTVDDLGTKKLLNSQGSDEYTCADNTTSKRGPVLTNAITPGLINDLFRSGYDIYRIQDTGPSVTTKAITSITENSAISGGVITDDRGNTIIMSGLCWSTNPEPDIYDNRNENPTYMSDFLYKISGLRDGTVYHVRAYAMNVNGTSYGEDQSFKTNPKPDNSTKPTVIIGSISNITHSSAKCSGTVTSSGTSKVTEKGICWDTSSNPTRSDNKVVCGDGTGYFEGTLTGLKPDTRYYVRAYAKNSEGTAYGEEIKFRTEKEEIKTIVPSNTAAAAPTMEPYTTYRVSISVADYTLAAPIAGESYEGDQVRGFYLRLRTEPDWDDNPSHQIFITNVSKNFDPVFGVKFDSSSYYLFDGLNGLQYINSKGKGGDEKSNTAVWGSDFTPSNSDNIILIRIYHYYGNETPQISFNIRVDENPM